MSESIATQSNDNLTEVIKENFLLLFQKTLTI